MTDLDEAEYPRLLSGVFAVADDDRTLVHTPFGDRAGPVGMYALLDRVAPALDGTRTLHDMLQAVPPRHEMTVLRMIELLVGARAIRMERCARPRDVGDELLAFLDLHTEDSYTAFHEIVSTPRHLQGPECWTGPLHDALAAHGMGNVRITSDPDEPVHLSGGVSVGVRDHGPAYEIGPGPGDPSPRTGVAEVIRRTIAAVMVERYLIETVRPDRSGRRYVNKSTGEITGYAGRSGGGPRERFDEPAGLLETLHDEAPTPTQLTRLVCESSAVLPRGPSGVSAPSMVRGRLTGGAGEDSSTAFATLGSLGRVLALGYGMSRVELGGVAHNGASVHRTVASARAFFPTELYVIDSSDRAWYVDPVAARLRSLGRTAGYPDLAGEVRVVVTVREGKTAFRYQKYATRLCAQEAALVCENLRIVAETLGMATSTSPMLRGRGSSSELGVRLSLLQDERPVAILEMSETLDQRHREYSALASALVSRKSGHAVFNSLLSQRDPHALAGVFDAVADATTEGVRCYAAVPPGMALAAGSYEISGDGPHLLREDPSVMHKLQAAHSSSGVLSVNYASLLGALFVTVPGHRVTADISEFFRWNARAGRLVQRVVIAAAKEQVCARIHNGFDPRSIASTLDTSTKELAIFQVLIGNANPDGTLTFPASTPFV